MVSCSTSTDYYSSRNQVADCRAWGTVDTNDVGGPTVCNYTGGMLTEIQVGFISAVCSQPISLHLVSMHRLARYKAAVGSRKRVNHFLVDRIDSARRSRGAYVRYALLYPHSSMMLGQRLTQPMIIMSTPAASSRTTSKLFRSHVPWSDTRPKINHVARLLISISGTYFR